MPTTPGMAKLERGEYSLSWVPKENNVALQPPCSVRGLVVRWSLLLTVSKTLLRGSAVQ